MKNNKRKKRRKRLQKKRQQYLVYKENKIARKDHIMSEQNTSCIITKNDDAELIEANYWETESARRGFFYLSINAGTFRLLVPESEEHFIKEMQTGKYCIVSKGPSFDLSNTFAIELLFEDHTDIPYHLILSAGQVERNPAIADAGHKYKLSVWTKGCRKVLEMDAYFRVVNRIPYLKRLGK